MTEMFYVKETILYEEKNQSKTKTMLWLYKSNTNRNTLCELLYIYA